MYRAVISLLILTLLVGSVIVINPRALAEATHLWQETRPTLVGWKDKALGVFQELINGESEAQIDREPVPPELNTDIIVTLNNRDNSLFLV